MIQIFDKVPNAKLYYYYVCRLGDLAIAISIDMIFDSVPVLIPV